MKVLLGFRQFAHSVLHALVLDGQITADFQRAH